MKHSKIPGCTSAASCESKGNFAPKVFTALLFLTLSFCFTAFSQTSLINRARPSCTLSGALEVRTMGTLRGGASDVVVLAEVAKADASTKFDYSFQSNASGAVVKSYGPVSYDPATKRATQKIVVTPGISGNEFNLKLTVKNSNGGVCNCSKSVSIIN